MHPFGVEYFYSKFWSMVMMPEYMALGVTAFIIILLIKAGMLILTGYKKFGMALLIAATSNIIIIAGLGIFFWQNIHFTSSLPLFCSAMIGAITLVDLGISLAYKGKSSWGDGIIGALLGNVIVACLGLIVIILELYPLA
jgi:hypothetical protein